jgi:pimeloyl-ACP methyl ester carboxylesterase
MTFMDVAPDKPNGRTVVLLHGKNFCAATWEATIKTLVDVGYRVIAPDQIGFCKSTKPEHYQYSFQQLADNACVPKRRAVDSRWSLNGRNARCALRANVSRCG